MEQLSITMGSTLSIFPSGNQYLFQKGNNVRLNCFQMVTQGDGECPYRSTLWRSYTRFSVCNVTATPWLWPLNPPSLTLPSPRLTLFFLFFSLVMSHSQGWGRSLPDRADKSESCSDWANRENMPASKQNEYTSPTLCLSLFFFFFDLPYLLFRPPTSWKYRGVLSPLEPPLPYSKELLTGRCKKDRSKGNRARKDVGGWAGVIVY